MTKSQNESSFWDAKVVKQIIGREVPIKQKTWQTLDGDGLPFCFYKKQNGGASLKQKHDYLVVLLSGILMIRKLIFFS